MVAWARLRVSRPPLGIELRRELVPAEPPQPAVNKYGAKVMGRAG